MIGVASAIIFCIAFIYVSFVNKRNFSGLISSHLALLAQTPVILFLHHNIDKYHMGEPAWPLMLPIILSILILSVASVVSLYENKSFKTSILLSPVLIGYFGYCVFCAISAVYGTNPSWSLYAIWWTLPFGFIFFIAGRCLNKLNFDFPYLSCSVIFSCVLSMSIVIFALLTNRADSLFNTRSFGSILAITGILQMLILYVPLASFEKRHSKWLNLLFWVLPPIAFAMSLSRSAIIPFLVYIFSVIYTFQIDIKSFLFNRRVYALGGLAGVVLVLMLFMTDIGNAWIMRFAQLPYAIQMRLELFAPFLQTSMRNSPIQGVGYGLTKFHHPGGYTDLHNMLLTEFFENGMGAGLLLAAVFILVFCYSVYVIFKHQYKLIAISIVATLFLAHIQGINLAIRNPGAYNTPYILCVLFFMFGVLEKQVLSNK